VLGLVHHMARDQQRHSGLCELPEAGPEVGAQHRVEAGGRLVEDQQLGLVEERQDQADLLPVAARELAERPVEVSAKALGEPLGPPGAGMKIALGTLDVFRPTVGAAALDAANNAANVAVVADILPRPDGSIDLRIEPGPNNTNDYLFYHLSAVQIESRAGGTWFSLQ